MARKQSDFSKLKKTWYKKLADSGFKDIEYEDGSISGSGRPRNFREKDQLQREITEEYYRMSYHFLNEYKFDSELEKTIWDYHTNGISIRDISKILKTMKIPKMGRDRVWLIVKRLEDKMKSLYLSV